MNLHLHSRFYHLIWMVWTKRKIEIEGHEITYAVLPKYFLLGGSRSKSWFVTAMEITKKSTQTLMIFISLPELNDHLLYTLYHEHLEGLYNLGLILCEENRATYQKKYSQALALLENDWSSLSIGLEQSLKNGQDKEHVFALIMELALAKERMDKSEFIIFLNNAIKNRL